MIAQQQDPPDVSGVYFHTSVIGSQPGNFELGSNHDMFGEVHGFVAPLQILTATLEGPVGCHSEQFVWPNDSCFPFLIRSGTRTSAPKSFEQGHPDAAQFHFTFRRPVPNSGPLPKRQPATLLHGGIYSCKVWGISIRMVGMLLMEFQETVPF